MSRSFNNYIVDQGTGCWIWGFRKPVIRSYHVGPYRAFYEHFVGPVPEGKQLLHICDNPRCVNPRHLRVGSHIENMYDRTAQGQRAKGGKMDYLWKFRAIKKRNDILKTIQSCAGV
jgi:hypothetical protein